MSTTPNHPRQEDESHVACSEQDTLAFLFLVTHRDYRPLPGASEPSGPLVFVRALPGNVMAWASDYGTAVQRARKDLERRMGSAPAEWYRSALRNMRSEHRERFLAHLLDVMNASADCGILRVHEVTLDHEADLIPS